MNRLEEDIDNQEGAEEIFYEEPDLSGGVEGVDYLIVYGAGEGSEGEQEYAILIVVVTEEENKCMTC